jgi:hypothetical protein
MTRLDKKAFQSIKTNLIVEYDAVLVADSLQTVCYLLLSRRIK